MWTKAELKEFVKLWEAKTPETLAQQFKVSKATIQQLATKLRKYGLKLTKKRRGGVLGFAY